MNRLPDAELVALLDTPESDRTERKRAWAGDAPDKVRQAVCAFANDLPGHALPGVVFIGGAADSHFRAFNSATGAMVWDFEMKASVYATPMTYSGPKGIEYVVVAAGGGGFFPGPLGDELVAFTLPK